MHITAASATSEPTSNEKVTLRAGKALEMRESFSDPRTLFGRPPSPSSSATSSLRRTCVPSGRKLD